MKYHEGVQAFHPCNHYWRISHCLLSFRAEPLKRLSLMEREERRKKKKIKTRKENQVS